VEDGARNACRVRVDRLDGAFAYAGMASFADVLSKQDVKDLHAFLAKPVDEQAKPTENRMH
jgi:quinohemoprotein ethanol dehydrogenase